MRHFARNSLSCVVFAIALGAGCGDDDNGGGGGTDGTTGTGGATMTTTNGMTTMTTTTDSTVSATGDTTGTPNEESTGMLDECESCAVAECGAEVVACLALRDCVCWFECLAEGTPGGQCMQECGQRPRELDALTGCVATECTDACGLTDTDGMETTDTGTETGTETTTGGDAAGYEQCQEDGDCTAPQLCNEFLDYCTIDDCQKDGDCPEPATGDVAPVCSPFGSCVLPCGNNSICPDDMTCQNVGMGNSLCLYP